MTQTEFEQIKRRFELEFGYKFLDKTRKRDIVEARATFITYLKRYKHRGLLEIARLINYSTGWKINHATIYHAIENYEMYSQYNPRLDEVMRSVIGAFANDSDKQQYIRNTITRLPSSVLNNVHQIVQDEYVKVLEKDYEELTNKI